MWVLGTNLIFAFPCKFWSSFRVPSYFDYKNTTLFQLLDFLIHNLHWFFYKVEFVIKSKLFYWNDKGFVICHWANPFKDFEWSNVPGVKLSSFSESDDTFTSLQALSNLHYLFLNKVDIGDDCGISSSTASEHTPSMWNEDFESDDEVDEVIFLEGNKWDDQFDIRFKGRSPLIWYLTPRDISSEGFNMKNCVADLVANGGWLWPQAWLLKAPDLGLIPIPTLIDSWTDLVQWRDSNGLLSYFSVGAA
ncbi:hypothetical protein Tco_0098416 [Tanacetum coccineum]